MRQITDSSGKTLTVFLIITSILLLSSTVIATFYYYDTSKTLEKTKSRLHEAEGTEQDLAAQLKTANRDKNFWEEKSKDAESQLNNCLDEVELEKGLREEIKNENLKFRETIEAQEKSKQALQSDLDSLQRKNQSLKEQVRLLNQKIESMQASSFSMQETLKPSDKKVGEESSEPFRPKDEGRVLRVSQADRFAIIDIGERDGLNAGTVLSLERNKKTLGQLKILRLQATMAVVEPVAPLRIETIEVDDKVVVNK